jgi:hypothetical protein
VSLVAHAYRPLPALGQRSPGRDAHSLRVSRGSRNGSSFRRLPRLDLSSAFELSVELCSEQNRDVMRAKRRRRLKI